MVDKRAQAGPAAGLISLIAVFLLLYILLIPPDLRDELLNDGKGSGKDPNGESPTLIKFNHTILNVNPGRIDFLKFREYEHSLPSVNLFTTTSANQIDIGDSIYVKNGIFDKKDSNLTFRLDDPENIKNAMIALKLNPNRNNQGRLTIKLNGKQIYNKEAGSVPAPIAVTNLEKNNVLAFDVTGVGWKFWTTNEYEADDIQLFFDLVDTSTQKSKNTFMITDAEKFNLESVTLKFFPDCNPREVGKLSAMVNRELIYSAVPDCGQLNIVEISTSTLEAGLNRVEFESARGQYLIDQILVKTDLKSMTYPVYYFDMPDALFSQKVDDDEDEVCGDIDGICPKDCDSDLDKDCCFEKTSNYWCDYQPNNQDDRCRAIRNDNECTLCPSGYEDRYGDPPEECEDKCGDDTDNDCPTGCSRFYDEDCCFEDDEDNFWCEDVPKFGLATCKDAITVDECEGCSAGWESDESDFRCPTTTTSDDEAILKSRFDVELILKFADDQDKKAGKIFINGYQFHFQTYDDEYKRNINRYVEDSTNSIKVEPDQTVLDIRQLVVEVED